ICGTRRQFERTKQEAPGLKDELDTASPEQRCQIGRGQGPFTERNARGNDIRLARRLDGEAAVVAFKQPNDPRRHHALKPGNDLGSSAGSPRCDSTDCKLSGVMLGSAASTWGAASSTLTVATLLNTVTNGSMRSMIAGGIPRTSHNSSGAGKGACRGT